MIKLTKKKTNAATNKVFDVFKSPIEFQCSENPRRKTKIVTNSIPKNITIFEKMIGFGIHLV